MLDLLATSDGWIESLMDEDLLIPALAIVFGSVIAIVAIIFVTITRTISARAREQTRREIAAYVAEGTISTPDAVALLEADATPEQLAERKKARA